jgi:flavin-dependent dehydrogenase
VKRAGLLSAVLPVIRGARAYYENVADLDPVFQLHYDRCLLPGYGWIFPLSGRRANVGVGCFPSGRFRRQPLPPPELFRRLVNLNPRCSAQLASAIVAGPIESRPLRVHFPTMQTQADNLLLVGEAAGLVNPFSGEGVGFAMESGLMAAEVAAEALADGDLSVGRLSVYGRRLRERYLSLFRSLSRMRDWYFRERTLNLIIGKAQKRPRLGQLLVGAALGVVDPREAVFWRTLRDIVR